MAYQALVPVCLFCFITLTFANNSLNDVLFNGDYEFIDLTYPFDNKTIYWPDSKEFEFTKKIENFQQDGSWYAANEFAAGEHGGTHIDAPFHFSASGQYVGQIPLDKLIVPLIIADISSKVNDDPNFVLYKHHLDYILNDNLGKPCLIVFKFGWSKFAMDKKKYLGLRSSGLNFPGISAEVAEWITTSYKNIVGIGVDVASADPGSNTNFPVHKIITRAGLYIIENVYFEKQIP
ncbi:unnamed protein product, partial [Parnassius apollo]